MNRLLRSLLATAAPAAVPFSPRREYYRRLRAVQVACTRVHPLSCAELTTFAYAPFPVDADDLTVMAWVRDNLDAIHLSAGC